MQWGGPSGSWTRSLMPVWQSTQTRLAWTEFLKILVGKTSDSAFPSTTRVVLGSRWQARQSLLANFSGALVEAVTWAKAAVPANRNRTGRQTHAVKTSRS